MPELNPLSNEQIFLKKIAENTGSNYNTGDVSEINPLTIDQILLKEIAANTAGQSGDITELEGKVADNTGAIEAIVNENGSCNILPAYRGTYTENGVVFTANSDGTVTVDATQTGRTQGAFWFSELFSVKSTLTYNVSGCPSNGSVSTYCLGVDDANNSTKATDTGEGDSFTGQTSVKSWIYVHPNFVGTLTFKPMLYDARLNPTGYVPYAMTNRELTEAVAEEKTIVQCDGVKTVSTILKELYDSINLSKITPKTRLIFYDNDYQFSLGCSCIISNQLKFTGLLECNTTNLYATAINMTTNLNTCLKYDTTIGVGGTTITDGSAVVFSANGYFAIIY